MENNSFKMLLPKPVEHILDVLQQNKYTAYVVGGCVRDAMLGREPHDYDICTSATPEQMKSIFTNDKYQTIDTGLQHGTITLVLDHEPYELTTYRVDGDYTDGRHPDSVQFVDNIEADLARRDYTINAMAYNNKSGLVDPFGGQEDLKNGIIRCVGDPNKRFQEDALRIMRAIRFASRYNFKIDENTSRAMHENKHLLKNVSEERKTVEFTNFITNTNADLLRKYRDVLAEFIPEIKPMFDFDQKTSWHKYDVWEHTVRAVESAPKNPTLRIAAFFHDIGKPAAYTEDKNGRGHFYNHGKVGKDMVEQIMKRMKFDNKSIEQVSLLVEHHDVDIRPDKTHTKKLLSRFGQENLRNLVQLAIADKTSQREPWPEMENPKCELTRESVFNRARIFDLKQIDSVIDDVILSGEPYRVKDLAIKGNDLIDIGIPRDKSIGIILNNLLNDVIKEPRMNNTHSLLMKAYEYKERICGDREEHSIGDR